MTIIATRANILFESTAVPLPLYARMAEIPECQFWGVVNGPDYDGNACSIIWTKTLRDTIGRYLAEAQIEIEKFVRWPLAPTWVTGLAAQGQDDRYVDARPYRSTMLARWCHIIQGGVRAVATIELAAPLVAAASDPKVATVATAITNTDEIKVYHPGSSVEIHPSAISISGGNATITIPRCRLVKLALADNDSEGLEYSTDSNFETTVDVKRVYNDPATQASLVRHHTCGDICASGLCTAYTEPACIYVVEPDISRIRVSPGTYTDGAWVTRSSQYCGYPAIARLNYQAGPRTPDLLLQAQDAVVRLAHSKMPKELCGCPFTQYMWDHDNAMPTVFTRERINCRFGRSDGAWAAWEFCMDMKVTRASVMTR